MEIIIYTPKAVSDLNDWKKSGNVSIQKKINELLQSIIESPYKGIGKPEPLKHELSGKWSCRINKEHRIIYAIDGNKIKYIFFKRSLLIATPFPASKSLQPFHIPPSQPSHLFSNFVQINSAA